MKFRIRDRVRAERIDFERIEEQFERNLREYLEAVRFFEELWPWLDGGELVRLADLATEYK